MISGDTEFHADCIRWNQLLARMCTNTQAHLVKGGQANLWTEFITTSDEVERMLYPRTCALAETLWNTKEKKEWEGFRQRISKFGAIMEKLNICYFKDEDWDNTGFVPQSEQRPVCMSCPYRDALNAKESSIICLNMRLTVIYRLSLQPPIP